MARPTKPEQPWYLEAADIMVRQGKNLRQAAQDLNVSLTVEEADTLFRRKSFQAVVRQARLRFHQEVANDPGRCKATLIGNLLIIAQALTDEGDHKKAAEVLFQVAKIEGYVGSESNVNIFANLNAENFAELRNRIKSGPGTERPDQSVN